MRTEDHGAAIQTTHGKSAVNQFDDLISMRGDVPVLTLPPPGRELVELVGKIARLGPTPAWRDDPLVSNDVSNLGRLWSTWPWHALRRFDPPQLRESTSATLHHDPHEAGRPREPFKPLAAAFMQAFLATTTQEIATHFRVVAATARSYLRDGREYWASFGAWPWASTRKANLPEEWWAAWGPQRALTEWIVVAGFSQGWYAQTFPEAVREDVVRRLGVGDRIADAVQANHERVQTNIEAQWNQRGYAGVPDEWRPPMVISMPGERSDIHSLELVEAVVYALTGQRCASGPLTR